MDKQASMINVQRAGKAETYKAVPMLVIESDPATGKPRLFRILYPEESIDVKSGMEFWIVYAKAEVLDAPGKS